MTSYISGDAAHDACATDGGNKLRSQNDAATNADRPTHSTATGYTTTATSASPTSSYQPHTGSGTGTHYSTLSLTNLKLSTSQVGTTHSTLQGIQLQQPQPHQPQAINLTQVGTTHTRVSLQQPQPHQPQAINLTQVGTASGPVSHRYTLEQPQPHQPHTGRYKLRLCLIVQTTATSASPTLCYQPHTGRYNLRPSFT